MYTNIGIMCATYPEARAVVDNMDILPHIDVQGFCFYELDGINFHLIIAISGIGLRNAMKCCRLLLQLFNINHVINFGTCGAISPFLTSGKVIIPESVYLLYNSSGMKIGDTGHKNNALIFLDHGLPYIYNEVQTISRLYVQKGTLVSTMSFLSVEEKHQLKDRGLDIVDMESAAIAMTCDFFGKIPLAIFKVVADSLNTQILSTDEYLNCEKRILNAYQCLLKRLIKCYIELQAKDNLS